MRIETIRLKNFKAFKDVTLNDIPPLCIIVGANGSGKTTLFDVFGFLKDCLTYNVQTAVQKRGGFNELVSRGASKNKIYIEIQFRMLINEVDRLVTYILEIEEHNNIPIVADEKLRYKRGRYGSPSYVLSFQRGSGVAVSNEEDFNDEEKKLKRDPHTLDSKSTLAIKGLGQFKRFKAANAFRQLIENWHVSDFHIRGARGAKDATGYFEHLSETGDNIQLVARHLQENHPEVFKTICERMQDRVPGISSVEAKPTEDGRILLKFGDSAFKDPFIDRYVSDGTLRMFAYLILLHDPSPHPLLCVEEPENQLYVSLLPELAEEFRAYAERGGQVFVSTHSPDFLNTAQIEEVYWLIKQDGFTTARRAQDDGQLRTYMENGDQMGWLWQHGLFSGADPR